MSACDSENIYKYLPDTIEALSLKIIINNTKMNKESPNIPINNFISVLPKKLCSNYLCMATIILI